MAKGPQPERVTQRRGLPRSAALPMPHPKHNPISRKCCAGEELCAVQTPNLVFAFTSAIGYLWPPSIAWMALDALSGLVAAVFWFARVHGRTEGRAVGQAERKRWTASP